jgi:hypothetical protein
LVSHEYFLDVLFPGAAGFSFATGISPAVFPDTGFFLLSLMADNKSTPHIITLIKRMLPNLNFKK